MIEAVCSLSLLVALATSSDRALVSSASLSVERFTSLATVPERAATESDISFSLAVALVTSLFTAVLTVSISLFNSLSLAFARLISSLTLSVRVAASAVIPEIIALITSSSSVERFTSAVRASLISFSSAFALATSSVIAFSSSFSLPVALDTSLARLSATAFSAAFALLTSASRLSVSSVFLSDTEDLRFCRAVVISFSTVLARSISD
ncbi:MAG: hypothetical protein HDS49_04770 [Bacteroides sp.]|nr:hypothetical protein [Bacteroides sp.]